MVEITTVDQRRRQVEAKLKDGGIVRIPILNIPTLFRWPKVGEYWVIRREDGQWTFVESVDPSRQMRDGEDSQEKVIQIEKMKEGEVRLTATPNEEGSGVWINRHQATRKMAFTIGEDSAFDLDHKLGTEHVTVALFREEGISVPYPEVAIVGPDYVKLTFPEIIPKDSVRVIITG